MKRNVLIICLGFLIFACKQPEPRKPVQQKTSSFIDESVERSKKLLDAEIAAIQAVIQKDTLNNYQSSDTGFWYFYEEQKDTTAYSPKTNDVVMLTYNVMNLKGDTIYKRKDIGLVQHAVDKSQLFPGLRNAVKLLKEGEQATFIFPSSLAYGYKGDNDKILPRTPIKTSLTLVEIKKDTTNLNRLK
ncbi:gliding motility-associated peptidyl-prolyl isomerase GldI [Croceivirga radicis]|uniref:Peptidyl-prolyl cis-trans isomerase n=1 Tax=Croceivirga radicis TaxID=1929488 RepID=A0A1V6LQT4_9FLAO|nr:gliding motility-associated peptidyl-prolyl isomerase GldI [Croceivirga radicis]OQD42316.1 gliding motility-associated peptidyl-prolyl isomerase GldI [Croceivirga radicis]